MLTKQPATPGSETPRMVRRQCGPQQYGGAQEQGAGEHPQDQPVHRWLQAAVVEVDVELAALDLLHDIA